MDFIVQLPKTKEGFDAIMTVVERLTKRAYFLPTRTDATAADIAQLFFDRIVCAGHGLPLVIVSDRDARFTSKFWQALFKCFGTKISMSTAFHPQTDGLSERLNRTIEEALRAFVSYNQRNWSDLLPALTLAYNNSINQSTGFTPYYLDFGQHPRTPMALLEGLNPSEETDVNSVEEFLTRMKSTLAIAKDVLSRAQDRQAQYANQYRKEGTFKIGDEVLLSTENIQLGTQKRRPSKKLTPKFIGPFKIIQKISDVTYKLDLPNTMRIHPVFHISLLKPFHPSPQEFVGRAQLPPPPIINEDGEEEFFVEKLLDKRIQRGQVQYLVKWEGYDDSENQWLPVKDIAEDLIKEFETCIEDNAFSEKRRI